MSVRETEIPQVSLKDPLHNRAGVTGDIISLGIVKDDGKDAKTISDQKRTIVNGR
jgi:hypothetical protein